MNEKKEYESPKINIVEIEMVDVITNSNELPPLQPTS